MTAFTNSIPEIEAFLILIMLLLGSVGFQAYTHKQYIKSDEDFKEIIRWIITGSASLALIVIILQITVLMARQN